jgi:hypothetical protein
LKYLQSLQLNLESQAAQNGLVAQQFALKSCVAALKQINDLLSCRYIFQSAS